MTNLRTLAPMAIFLLWQTLAYASNEVLTCNYEADTGFGLQLSVEYDEQRKSIKLIEHRLGSYAPYFTLGNVANDGSSLEFSFEVWDAGIVAVLEQHSIELQSLTLASSKSNFSADGQSSAVVASSTGTCESNQKQAISTKTNPQGHAATGAAAVEPMCYKGSVIGGGARYGYWCVDSSLAEDDSGVIAGAAGLVKRKGSWCEGEDGHGIGTSIEISYEPREGKPTPSYDRLWFENGHDVDDKSFYTNSRVKKFEIQTDDGRSWIREVKDRKGYQSIEFGEFIQPNGILVTILDVYPGKSEQNTCISLLFAEFE